MTQAKIYVAGHQGMVGSAIVRTLLAQGTPASQIIGRTHAELDLCNQAAVQSFFESEKPTQVYLAAAKVGGIHANNTYPADFIYVNLMVQANVIHAAHTHGVQKLLFLGSSCIYPRLAPQPMTEAALLTGALEPTNEPYAVAKIAGIKLCESYNRQYGRDYRSVMPTNLYGPGDNYHPQNSHVIPALIRRFHEAKRGQRPGGRDLGHRHSQARVFVCGRHGLGQRLCHGAAAGHLPKPHPANAKPYQRRLWQRHHHCRTRSRRGPGGGLHRPHHF